MSTHIQSAKKRQRILLKALLLGTGAFGISTGNHLLGLLGAGVALSAVWWVCSEFQSRQLDLELARAYPDTVPASAISRLAEESVRGLPQVSAPKSLTAALRKSEHVRVE